MTFRTKLAGTIAGAFLLVPAAARADTITNKSALSDTGCFGYPVELSPIQCRGIDGSTRTQTTVNETYDPWPGGQLGEFMLSGTYDVNFAGSMVNNGAIPVTVDSVLSYQGHYDQVHVQGSFGQDSPLATYQSYSDVDLQVQSMHVSHYVTYGGTDPLHAYTLSIDPTTSNGPTAQLTGVYQQNSTADNPAIVYGKVTGTLTATAGSTGPYQGAATLTAVYNTTETTRLDSNGLVTPKVAVTDGINMNGSKVTNLAAGTGAGDAVNKAQLDAESAARAAAYNALATGLASNKAQLDAESAARAAADTALTAGLASNKAQLDAESATRAAADAALASGPGGNTAQLDAESATRAAADTALASGLASNKAQLDAESATRAAADTALASSIASNTAQLDVESTTRAAADTQLAAAVDTEATTRAAVDNTLAANLSSETSARIAADANLSSRLDGLSSRVDALNGRIDRVQRRADAGTAVAVAMGGAVFLPDTHFNLTANVATYGGARAGAVQVGAMVGRHVAFNAGVATGFNRGGQTAGRAGFTVGW